MTELAHVIIAMLQVVCIVLGSFLCLSAAVGILRFPDVYARMHAASKAGTLGLGFLFLASTVHFGNLEITIRAAVGVLFFVLTAPISAHLLARAAYWAGVKPWEGAGVDQLSGRYHKETHRLDGYPFEKRYAKHIPKGSENLDT
ncbi:monovalent cation/H(+) antiporter subunit G [Rhodoligotrophos defluvii]|uniref:monovalent cation/H(+) antiporter subunit G n=1 Tax=Rhodoligotrophos defluvii TaxID=2561934 RepID=UPI0010C975AC|nr:monovalent cation/H(+) antiporter subunit G [Rhodoligotrophos defluvii]